MTNRVMLRVMLMLEVMLGVMLMLEVMLRVRPMLRLEVMVGMMLMQMLGVRSVAEQSREPVQAMSTTKARAVPACPLWPLCMVRRRRARSKRL